MNNTEIIVNRYLYFLSFQALFKNDGLTYRKLKQRRLLNRKNYETLAGDIIELLKKYRARN